MPDPAAITLDEVEDLARRVFLANGFAEAGATILARTIRNAERDGPRSHGLFMLPAYVASVKAGWADPTGTPSLTRPRPATLAVDGANGFAQVAIDAYRADLIAAAREFGVATMAVRNSHHIAALRGDVEPFAEAGMIAIMSVASRLWLAPWGGTRKAFGTNPMAFACPRPDGPPIVWDMASAAIAVTEVRMAAAQGHDVPPDCILDAAGNPTTDPGALAKGGMLLPVGRHKGTAIALMVEVLAAALTGGSLALEDRSGEYPGAMSANGGQLIIAIDPSAGDPSAYAARLGTLMAALAENGDARVPGDGRLARRQAADAGGVKVDAALLERLNALL